MAAQLKPDTLQALADWKAGKPVRSIELGHVHRMKEHPGLSPAIDEATRLHNDQDRAHAYCFRILGYYAAMGRGPESHEEFQQSCDFCEALFRMDTSGLTAEELDGAESLAWKALQVGWRRAIDGHKDVEYIEIKRPDADAIQDQQATVTVNGKAL